MEQARLVPVDLTSRPFTLAQALAHGLTEDRLRGTSWRRVDRGVFAWHAIAQQRMVRLQAALYRLPQGGVFSGSSAGWLHGLDLDPCDPIEVTVPAGSRVTRRAGFKLHRSATIELSTVRGLPVTSPVRTVVDLARGLPLVQAVTVLDMALHVRLVTVASLQRWTQANRGRRGVARLRHALELAEAATESPMETRLRLLLVLAGLPKPLIQPTLRAESGIVLARPDLYYAVHRLVIEYDGATHRDSLARDNRRQNTLLEAGYRILRFTAGDVLGNPSGVVSLVRRAIARPSG